jgi:uncharacterized protein (UPF0261 family)
MERHNGGSGPRRGDPGLGLGDIRLGQMRMTRYVAILGSLDTKGAEIDFVRQVVRAEGGQPLVIDTGVLDKATIPADVTRHEVAGAANSSIEELIRQGDKARALVTMAEGAGVILRTLFQEGRLGGVLSIGGSRGTALSTWAMQVLPVGVPKLMVSTMANGKNPFGPYVGTKDVTIMHSVADVQGINAVTRPILTNAAAAVVAMSRVGAAVQRGQKRVFTASMLGVSTALVGQIQTLMEREGGEVIGFHAVGTGGQSMEELIDSGIVEGVFDVTPGEMTALVVDGPFSAGPDRMRAAGRRGIPQVIAPGGVDFIIEGPLDRLPARYRERQLMSHTPTISLVRTSAEEMARAARLIAERLAASAGPAAMILPCRAFGWFAREGQPLHNPESDRAFIDTFKAQAPAGVQIVEMDTHLNDPVVGETAVRLMQEMLA